MSVRAFHFPSGGKYTKETAFFNISRFLSSDSYIWFWVSKALHLRPEILCLASLACAIAGSFAILHGSWWWALLWIHLTDSLDCADGTLARYTGKATRFGRFLDVLVDGIGVTALVVAITIQVSTGTSAVYAIGIGALLWLCLFLECSMMNFSNLQYARYVGSPGVNSRQDEHLTDADRSTPLYQRVAHVAYLFVFGWQDSACLALHTAVTRNLTPKAERLFSTTKLFVTLHTLFSFRVSLSIIAIVAAYSSVLTAVGVWFAVSTTAFGILMGVKMLYAQQLRTIHITTKSAYEKPANIS